MNITPAQALAALQLPRPEGKRSVEVNGVMVSVVVLRRISESAGGSPVDPPRPIVRQSVFERPDSEKVEGDIISKHTQFEASAQPLKTPQFAKQEGEHMKSYLINYINRKGEFHCEKMAAKGIVTAISLFYMQFSEKAIVSVICVL